MWAAALPWLSDANPQAVNELLASAYTTTEASQSDEVVLTVMQSSLYRAVLNATSDTSHAVSLSVMESSRKLSGGCPNYLGMHHLSTQAAAQFLHVAKVILFIDEL